MLVDRMARPEAVDLVHHCLETGRVIPGFHFRKGLADENLTMEDAFCVLKNGQIYDEPEPDSKTGEWKYRIEGHEPGGKWLAIILCFKQIDDCFLITVFSVSGRSRS